MQTLSRRAWTFLAAAAALLVPAPQALAEEGGGLVNIVNWYYVIANAIFHDEHAAEYWWPVISAFAILLLIAAIGLASGLYRVNPEKLSDEELLPPKAFGLRGFLEIVWGVVAGILELVIGKGRWMKFAPILGGTFLFILFSNLSGLLPGFMPSTETFNTTLAMGLFIFLMFNYWGFKYAGMDYLKHMAGPLIALAPLIFVIELIGMMARPLSLGFRLMGNIWSDHLVFKIFSSLVQAFPFVPVPAALLFFGMLVACLQAIIFTMLSSVYVMLAIDSKHEEGHH